MSADGFAKGPPPGARADWTIDQGWDGYSPAEHQVWMTLYERQTALLPGRACDPFLKGLEALDLHRSGIPDFARINAELNRLTGSVATDGATACSPPPNPCLMSLKIVLRFSRIVFSQAKRPICGK